MKNIIMIIFYLMLTVSGLILIKLGKNVGNVQMENKNLLFSINIISAIGFVCYILSFLIFTRIIVMFDLSYIYPILTGFVQIATVIASCIIFKDSITTKGIVGSALVIIGIIIMNLPKGQVN